MSQGDGAKWIWNLADEHFPDAVQIVDRFHAKQHLSDVAKSIYGAGSDLAKQWARERHDELDAGDIDAILNALRLHSPKDDEARKCVDYVERNRWRMRYPEFRAAGLCTSTGVVEAGCKLAIGTRCKRAGMHWTVAGVDAIIALRCCKLSGRFEEFWERVDQVVHVSATPADYEIETAGGRVVEQILRPTGLIDPKVIIKPAENQVDDLLDEKSYQGVLSEAKGKVITIPHQQPSSDHADGRFYHHCNSSF